MQLPRGAAVKLGQLDLTHESPTQLRTRLVDARRRLGPLVGIQQRQENVFAAEVARSLDTVLVVLDATLAKLEKAR